MKTKLLLGLLVLSLASCGDGTGIAPASIAKPKPATIAPIAPTETIIYSKFIKGNTDGSYNWVGGWECQDFKIVDLYGCQYVVGYTSSHQGGPYFAHWGRCKYCAERRKTELHDIVVEIMSIEANNVSRNDSIKYLIKEQRKFEKRLINDLENSDNF